MGSGYSACYADTVDEKFVRKIVGDELFDAFQNAFSEEDATIQDMCDGAYPKTQAAYQKVCDAFLEKTELMLDFQEHNASEDGDRYDEVDGAFWCVDGVFQRTPAGEKYRQQITRVHYVTYG